MGILSTHVLAALVLATATIPWQRLFNSELPIVRLLFEGSDYLRAASNRSNTVLCTITNNTVSLGFTVYNNHPCSWAPPSELS